MTRAFVVAKDEAGKRLDVYVSERLSVTRSQVAKWGDCVLVNDGSVKRGYALREGDRIHVTLPPTPPSDILPQAIPITVVYEDDDLAVVRKPAGLVVHPSPGETEGTLVNALMHHLKGFCFEGDKSRAGIVHRLDKDTEGLLVVGKRQDVVTALQAQFKARTVEKVYYAIVVGIVGEDEGRIDQAIARHPVHRKKMCVREDGRRAITDYAVVERLRDHTLLCLRLRTGRTHQARVHCHFINHPIIGDRIYSRRPERYPMTGLALIAKVLSFNHPATGERVSFETEFGDEFIAWRKRLRG